MGKLFGTDGVRGIANQDLTPELAFNLGRAGSFVLGENNHNPKIVIGKDTRISGDMLESALIAGICSMGGDVIQVGVMPTPGIAVLTKEFKADAGIVISASHNPAEFNGIKFFNSEGFKLSDDIENEIERLVLEKSVLNSPVGIDVGKVIRVDNPEENYINILKKSIDGNLEGLKIVLDCANGASYKIAPRLFEEFGAKIKCIGVCPDGININENCGSTHMELLQKKVVELGAHFGLAFDGDADRLLAVDELGRVVDGDRIMNIFANSMMRKGSLKGSRLVATVMSNMGLEKALESINCKFIRTAVGDRYVLERMLKEECNLGGEQSGHIIMLDYNTTGDGLMTSLQLSKIVKEEGKPLSELADMMKKYPQVLVNAKVKNENKYQYDKDEEILKEINIIENNFHNNGRVVIRPSGTEPLVRIMLEGENQEALSETANKFAKLIEQRLG